MAKSNPVLGIIGGGQLGSMLSVAAKNLKIKTIIFTDDRKAPIKNFCDEVIISDYDDKDKIGLEDEWYTKIIYFHPPRSGPSLQDGFVNDDVWKEEKDMSGELLTKVQRNNKIMVEFKGLSTISRTD